MLRRFRKFILLVALLLPAAGRAGEVALLYLPNARVEYEGTGYRRFDEGWELKVKPWAPAAGVRWEHPLAGGRAWRAQYWTTFANFDREDGNAVNDSLRQTGQTRLTLHSLMTDVRLPVEGAPADFLVGLQGVYERFERKDIVFNGVAEAGRSRENLAAAGAYMGFAGGRRADGGNVFYWAWEAVLGHLFATRNSRTASGGSIRREGYTYAVRLEAGARRGRWGLGAGFARQLYQVHVRGGKTFPGGAAASLPINKTDFFSPYVTVGYEY